MNGPARRFRPLSVGILAAACGGGSTSETGDIGPPTDAATLGPDWPLSGVMVADPIHGPVGSGQWSELGLTEARTVREWNTVLTFQREQCLTACLADVSGWRHQAPLPQSEEPMLFGPQWSSPNPATAVLLTDTSEGPLWELTFSVLYSEGFVDVHMYCDPQPDRRLRCRWSVEQLVGPDTVPEVEAPKRGHAVWWTIYDGVEQFPQRTQGQALERYLLAGQGY